MSALTYGINATTSRGPVTIIKTVTVAQLMAMHTENVMLVPIPATVILVCGIHVHATSITSSVTITKQ